MPARKRQNQKQHTARPLPAIGEAGQKVDQRKDGQSGDTTSDLMLLIRRKQLHISKSVKQILLAVLLCIATVGIYLRWNTHRPISGAVVTCVSGSVCSYSDEVDIRMIVLTFNRPLSLHKCLNSTKALQTAGDRASMEIWVDRAASGTIDQETLMVANNFTWSQGSVRVNVQSSPAGLHGQWINTWRPKPGSRELALYLEDDVDISPFAYRWLKSAWARYHDDPHLGGVVLQDEYIITASGKRKGVTFPRPEQDPLFMYPIIMPWGFAPNPTYWSEFQDWYHKTRLTQPHFLPFLPEAGLYNSWFEDMVKENRTHSMWTMWFNYFCHMKKIYLIYGNLPKYSGRNDSSLVVHRRENGLHFGGRTRESSSGILLTHWRDEYVQWPEKIKRYSYDGSFVT